MRCNDYCCNFGCNQGRNCPARTTKAETKIERFAGVLVALAIGSGLALALIEWWV